MIGVGVGDDGWVVAVKEELAVVPDLIVFEIGESYFVEPLDLVEDGKVELREDLEAVEPDGVVGGVHGDDEVGEAEAAGGVFLSGHDGAEVGDG